MAYYLDIYVHTTSYMYNHFLCFHDLLLSLFYNKFSPFLTSRMISYTITDDSSGTSTPPAIARVSFNAIDDTPYVDLNGPTIGGDNLTVPYTEGNTDGVKVIIVCNFLFIIYIYEM